jgi:multiple sugar transport system substrate-binding protein
VLLLPRFIRRDLLIITVTWMMLLAVTTTLYAADVTLTVLWRTTVSELETMQEAFRAFEASHPGIKVELISEAGAKGDDKLKTMFAAGTPPDIFASVFVAGFMDYVYTDMLLDLTPYVQRDKFNLNDFLPGSVDIFTINGHIYALPRGGVGSIGFYNADLFDQAGLPYPPTKWEDPSWTWDYAAEIAKKLTVQQPDGRYTQIGIQQSFWTALFNHAPLMWGTCFFSDEMYEYGIGTTTLATDPTVIESFQRILDLRHVDGVMPAEVPTGGFAGGKVGMYFSGGGLAQFQNMSSKWSIMPYPRGLPGVQQKSATYTGPLMIAKTTKHPQEAWELLKFLVNPEGQRYIAPGATIGTGRVSMLRWMANRFNVSWDVYSDVMFGAYVHGRESANVRLVDFGTILSTLSPVESQMWSGKMSAKQALEEVAPRLDALLSDIYNKNLARKSELFGSK